MVRTTSGLMATLAAALLVEAQAPADAPSLSLFPSPWAQSAADGWEAAYAQARAFVSNLTLVEKVNLTTGTGWEFDRCVGNTGSIPRLGFRSLCLEDGTVAVRYTDHNSVFPAGVNAAATFSRDLMRRRGLAMGAEFRGKGIDVQLGPVAGPLGRVPAGGRNWEGFSPDPYLTGVSIAETVQGIQTSGVIACAKHYILNEQEHFRNNVDVQIDDRTMHEVYLWPFADAVRAGVGSLMCSYNKINGNYSCENPWTINYLLKNELNFQGFVMSDWGAQHSTVDTALAGLDLAMPGDGGAWGNVYGAFWGGTLTEAVLNGTIPAWRVDDMAVRIMAAVYKMNQGRLESRPEPNFSAWVRPNVTVGPLYFRANQSIQPVNLHVNVQADHAVLIREMGAKSAVLLKNTALPGNGGAAMGPAALPLVPGKIRRIAVIGDDAQDPTHGLNACDDNKCYGGTLATGYGSGPGYFPYLVAPATALRARAATHNATTVEAPDSWNLTAAQDAARGADVALVFANADSGEGYITIDGNTGDRNNLTLWGNGDALVAAVAAVNNNTVVVLHTVGPVLLEAMEAHPNITAILWAGLPGQESGNALTDVLYGDVAPQGRSPFTWGRNVSDYGAQLMYTSPTPFRPSQNFSEGVYIDYRYFQHAHTAAVYPFGHGLTYTRFDFGNLTVQAVKPVVGVHRNATVAKTSTGPAPRYGSVNTSVAANEAPPGFHRIHPYIYPWIVRNNSLATNVSSSATPSIPVSTDPRTNGSTQPILPAGGAPGGHPGLYETMYKIAFDIQNIGKVAANAVPQLYVQLGGDNPWGVLRGFDSISVQPNGHVHVEMNLTRRDISNWDSASQNWVVTNYTKYVFVGRSVSDIALNATLPPLGW
ncbi:glycoside hydrolase family 3 protein [Niveomyces insectorum RCEF 264]|uniref:beta-glucosidase n=1 Tax=Niveomyces insectorum RCEF 264 TaxID=1081102 RepID=A0A167MNS1_9HYPO|nr:glycoside hydrolase family 3 protein [Niveomyces insectorum RCEF 264]